MKKGSNRRSFLALGAATAPSGTDDASVLHRGLIRRPFQPVDGGIEVPKLVVDAGHPAPVGMPEETREPEAHIREEIDVSYAASARHYDLKKAPFPWVEGFLAMAKKPGLGINLGEDAVERFRL